MTILDYYKSPNGKFDSKTLRNFDKHNLLGFIYSREKGCLNDEDLLICEKKYLWQKALNLATLKEVEKLNKIAAEKKLNWLFLKGSALLNTVYTDLGERYLSDIDVYVDINEKDILYNVMNESYYEIYPVARWALCDHKDDFSKKKENEVEMHLDVHYKLLLDVPLRMTFNSHSYLPTPSLEIMFFHLVTHLGYQHTYLRLNWLMDIYLFTKKFSQQLDWMEIYKLFAENHLLHDLKTIKYLLNKYFDQNIPLEIPTAHWEQIFFDKILTPQFLLKPQQYKIKYYLLKHYLNTSLYAAFKYDLHWLFAKLKGIY